MGVNLLICIHNHQPVGNFPWVFEDAFEHSYGPFMEVLKKYPEIKITLHNTGPLLDWMEGNRPEYLDTLKELAGKGQVEIMGGAYYEPIISIIPAEDAKAQIKMMSGYIRERFGKVPEGMWLAERVWEPTLPRITAPMDIRYTLLDDTHFRYAGLNDEELFGYYITEYSGLPLSVFPIDRGLRYTIPFKEPHESISRLKEIARDHPGAGVVYGDDGEKFGVWPGTYDWVFKEKWLEKFFDMLLENSNWINLMTFSEYMDEYPPAGRIYLPTASYEEMMEWALPADAILKYKDVSERLGASGMGNEARPFLRGGFFNNFLTKYPEANNMHKRMLRVSTKAACLKDGNLKNEAKRYVMAAQCNCAYWHGLFGGLYLNYLRHAIYENLGEAENIADKDSAPYFEIIDINADGRDEVLLYTPHFTAYISPHEGGSLYHLDIREFNFCLSNTMSRRFEAYHKEALEDAGGVNCDGDHPESIHDRMHIKEEGLLDLLTYDNGPRYSFLDRFFASPPDVDSLVKNRFDDAGDFSSGDYQLVERDFVDDDITISLERVGSFVGGSKIFPLTVKKMYNLSGEIPALKVSYTIECQGDENTTIFFGPELNFTLLGGEDPKRYLLLPGGKKSNLKDRGVANDIEEFSLVNEYDGFEVRIRTSRPSTLLYYGVETASRSEGGLERTYQGSAFMLVFKIKTGYDVIENVDIIVEVSRI